MRRSMWKFNPQMKNSSLSATLSFILSMALVFLPVFPVTAASERAVTTGDSAAPASPAFAPPAAPVAPALAAPLAPSLTATKTDSFADPDGDGKAEPGQNIIYTVTITNNGTDAANVVFNDTVDPNTTLVNGSVRTQPIAANDSYSVLGNVRIQPGAAQGLLANDCDPDNGGPCSSAGLVASGPATSAQGGNVSVNADGSFSYNPPAGFEGADSFTYTVTDAGGQSDTATATFNVSGMVWFVDNSAAASGDGRLTSPFNALAPLNGASDPDDPGDLIFVHQGAAYYGGGIALEDGQRLIGQGISLDAALAAFGISAPAHSDARPAATGNPTLANAGGNVITLANGNTVAYLNAAASAAASSAIFGSAAGGTTTIGNVGLSANGPANGLSLINMAGPVSVSNSAVACNSSGTAVLVNGGAAGINFDNTSVGQNGGRVVYIHNRAGGLIQFSNASTVTGANGTIDAVALDANAAGSIVTFAGSLQLNTGAAGARGLVASGASGSTLNVTGGGNAVSSTGAAAVDIENITANITFSTTFSTDSNASGVRVHNVTGTAAFGNTTVNNSAATGVSLSDNAAAVTFSDLDIAPGANQRALHATNNTGGITATSGVVAVTGATAVEVVGPSAASRTPLNLQLTSVSASGGPNGVVVQNTSAAGSPGGFRVVGTGGDCSPVAPACSGGRITASVGSDNTTAGIGVLIQDAASISLSRMRIDNHPNHALSATALDGFTLDSSLVDGANGNSAAFDESAIRFRELMGSASLTNSFIGGGHEFIIDVRNTGGTSLNRLTIANNTIGDLDGGGPAFGLSTTSGDDALHLSHGVGAGVFNVTVAGNTINSGRGDAVNFITGGTVVSDFVLRNNVIHNTHPAILSGGGGVTVVAGGGVSAINATYDISCNSFRGAKGHSLLVAKAIGGGLMRGTIFGNVFGVDGIAASSSSEASGINIDTRGGGTHTVLVKNNVVHEWGANGAIQIFNNQGSATMNATVVGNVTNNPDQNNALAALYVEAGALSGDTSILNIKIGGAVTDRNDFREGDPFDGGVGAGNDVLLSRVTGAGTQFNLSRGVSAASDVQQIISDNNIGPVSAANAGIINFVNTTPALPPIVSLDCNTPVASNFPVELPTTVNHETQATTQTIVSGFSAENLFAHSLVSLSLDKTRRGFAYAERARTLRLDSAETARPQTPRAVLVAAPVATVAGGTVNVQIGALRAGDSVTITFEAQVADPFTGAQPQVSNQGTVTADGGVSVQTDDPDVTGAANPTVTQLLLPPSIAINDGAVAEPATGTANALFTVSLSHAYTQNVSVNFSTANGGPNPATAEDDYTPTNGSVTFQPGQIVQTFAVPVLADGIAGEGAETFLVNLSGASNGVITDAQAVGTINDPSVASPVIISELRQRGPNGAHDDFVELLNTTDADITVTASDGSQSGWSIVQSGDDCSDTPVMVGVIPEGTVIPARGNFLLTGSAYSLGAYSQGDAALSADVESNHNIGLFSTADVARISSANRLDAVGFGTNTNGNCDLLREGNTLSPLASFNVDYSLVRKVSKGETQDTTDNAADFIVVDTNGTMLGNTQRLGAPGPEGLNSPRGPVPCSAQTGSALFGRGLLDSNSGVGDGPNFVRNPTADVVNHSTHGTLDFRRTFTNNTGATVTALRFRIVDLSTFPSAAGTADLRARTSSTTVVATSGGNKTVNGTMLGTTPAQPNGGGINASLAAGSITLATPLVNGASVNLRFLFGVEQVGDYDIAVVLESSPSSGKDFWRLTGHTENGGHSDRGCNRPPVANAGLDQTAECSNGQASITLDGSASSDPDGDTPLSYEWSEGGNQLGTGQTLNISLAVGSHLITLKVTDPSGDSSQDTVTINVVDTTAPVVTPPPAVVVYTGPSAASCGTTVNEAALGSASAADACEGAGLPVTRTGVPAGNFFPVGPTLITYTATDAAGNTGVATQTVTVIDNTAPVVMPPADITTPNEPDSCSATVNPGAATATDNCAVQTITGTRSDNQPLNAPYPVGATTITWTATDTAGNTATAMQTVTVQDTQAPSVSSSVAVTMMGSPFNHALINVGLAATATDNCPGFGPVQVSVYSDEDDGAAPHSPDAFNIGLGTLRLRRERDGDRDGRVYLVVLKATDAWGNTGSSCRTVTVPLSNSAAHINAVNAQAAAAASFCSANNGTAPSGFFVVGP